MTCASECTNSQLRRLLENVHGCTHQEQQRESRSKAWVGTRWWKSGDGEKCRGGRVIGRKPRAAAGAAAAARMFSFFPVVGASECPHMAGDLPYWARRCYPGGTHSASDIIIRHRAMTCAYYIVYAMVRSRTR